MGFAIATTNTEATGNDVAVGKTQRFSCARHGEHDAVMNVTIFQPPKPGQWSHMPRDAAVTRNYCMRCYIEHMDRAGVRDMDPIK